MCSYTINTLILLIIISLSSKLYCSTISSIILKNDTINGLFYEPTFFDEIGSKHHFKYTNTRFPYDILINEAEYGIKISDKYYGLISYEGSTIQGIELRYETGNNYGRFKSDERLISVKSQINIDESSKINLGIKHLLFGIHKDSIQSLLFDIGYSLSYGRVSGGISLNNLSKPIKLGYTYEKPPTNTSAYFAIKSIEGLIIAIKISYEHNISKGLEQSISLGWQPISNITFSTGYLFRNTEFKYGCDIKVKGAVVGINITDNKSFGKIYKLTIGLMIN